MNNDRRQKPKGDRVLHQQISCILNGKAVINHYNEYLQKKEEVALRRIQNGKARKHNQKGFIERSSIGIQQREEAGKKSTKSRKAPLAKQISHSNIAENSDILAEDEIIYL